MMEKVMENWLFWAVIVFLLIMLIIGIKKGLIKMVFSVVSIIAAIVLAIVLCPYVSGYIKNKTPIYSIVREKTSIFVENAFLKMEESAGESKKIEELPLPKVLKDQLIQNNNDKMYDVLGAKNIGEYVSEYVSNVLIKVIAFCIIFIAALIIIKILVYTMNLISSKMPLVNGLNRLLGGLLGLIEGFIILWLLCLVVTAGAGSEWGQKLTELINNSTFLSFIYNNNYLMRVLTEVLKLVF